MAIKKIPNITINGANQCFGGYIFSADFETNITSPSKLTLSFLAENGTYPNDPALSVTTPYKIAVGDLFTADFYAISWEKGESSQGKRLDVTFYDGSIILDRKWIGLYKKAGEKGIYGSLIVLGSETHPCDVNDDRVFDAKDISLLYYDNVADPCTILCPGEIQELPNTNVIANECNKKDIYQILQVQYNFSELIHYIKAAGIQVNTPNWNPVSTNQVNWTGTVKDFYYADYADMSLRDCLSRWCDDLALTYYWENGGLNFVDSSVQPKINIPNITCIGEKTSSKTLEGTIGRGAITYYGHDGIYLNKLCADPRRNELRCLTLGDLFENGVYKPSSKGGFTGIPQSSNATNVNNNNDNDNGQTEEYQDDVKPNGVPLEQFEISCICSFYDKILREQNILYQYYGMRDQVLALNFIGKRLDRYGALRILDVFSSNANGQGRLPANKPELYDFILGQSYKNGPYPCGFTAEQGQYFKDHGGYFIIAELDQKKLEDQFHLENNLASNFLGKHWIKAYYQSYYGSQPEVTPVGQYLAAGNIELKNVEFAKFYHSNNSRIAQLGQEFMNDPANLPTGQPVKTSDDLYHNVLSLLYYQKNPVWSPDLNLTNPFKDVLDGYAERLPGVLAKIDFKIKMTLLQNTTQPLPKDIPAYDPDEDSAFGVYCKNPNLVVMAMYPGYEFTVVHSDATNPNPDEENQYYQLMPTYREGNDGNKMLYGLTSQNCYQYTINGIPIFTPAGSSVLFDGDADIDLVQIDGQLNQPHDLSAPRFAVMVTASQPHNIQIPKVETSVITPPPDDECMKVEYIVKAVNDNSIKPLNNIVYPKPCILSHEVIQKFHEKINVDLDFSITEPFETQKITIAGLQLPNGLTSVSIANGLQSISVRIDDSAAVSTSFTFSNSLFKHVSENVALRALELRIQNLAANSNSNFFTNISQIPKTSTSSSG